MKSMITAYKNMIKDAKQKYTTFMIVLCHVGTLLAFIPITFDGDMTQLIVKVVICALLSIIATFSLIVYVIELGQTLKSNQSKLTQKSIINLFVKETKSNKHWEMNQFMFISVVTFVMVIYALQYAIVAPVVLAMCVLTFGAVMDV